MRSENWACGRMLAIEEVASALQEMKKAVAVLERTYW
jgi:hypothetical protein